MKYFYLMLIICLTHQVVASDEIELLDPTDKASSSQSSYVEEALEEVIVTPDNLSYKNDERLEADEELQEILDDVIKPFRIPPPSNKRNPADRAPVYTIPSGT